jgi:hypothetical protein
MIFQHDNIEVALEVPELLKTASAWTGLDDFGDRHFHEPLEVLVRSLKQDAWPKLSPTARRRVGPALVAFLANRLRIVADRANYPAIRDVGIKPAFFVTGCGRSGTTLLQTLLAQDPENAGIQIWEFTHPSPPPGLAPVGAARLEASAADMGKFLEALPEIRIQHQYYVEDGTSALAECGHALFPAFTNIHFWYYYPVSGYLDWLFMADHRAAMAFHRNFLQHLEAGREGVRWSLKAPEYLLMLDAVVHEYPDANILWGHRDIPDLVSSLCSSFTACRSLGAEVTPESRLAWGREIVDVQRRIFDRGIELRERLGEARFLDVSYGKLMRDPIGTIRAIYTRFGLELSDSAILAIRAWMAANPPAKHGAHQHRPEDFGFDAATLNREFSNYRARFADYLD